ncbi:uncharacterized protein LOC119261812 [Pygocentrus nattereri]|uniref:uncharacterized protein LOC119261812 n=1 Tax=Pygocentrus nattereri TaxID=42514 RepID=UPI0018911C18|nr:uncharacterized protein LOC119261812 [Pygocentrus nattereri]XP_037387460.1 uncharacterized protein LOC119261812 [Pygocentrus nattereri]
MDFEPINEIQISVSEEEEIQLNNDGFTRVDGNLNSGTTGPDVFLWYKKGGNNPVTRIQSSYRIEMNEGLTASGFTSVDKNINTTGHPIKLFYKSDPIAQDFWIVDLKVTTRQREQAALFLSGIWERLGCNLNRNNGGDPVYIWVRRREKTYICDITATVGFNSDIHLFNEGYIRMDEDTNQGGPDRAAVFIWYRRSNDYTQGITGFQVSVNDEEKVGFTKVDTDLNFGTTENRVYLWYNREHPAGGHAVQQFLVLVGDDARMAFQRRDIGVLKVNLNHGISGGVPLYITYNTLRHRRQ